MNTTKLKGVIFLFLFVFVATLALPVSAVVFTFEETGNYPDGLYASGSVAGIYPMDENTLFVVDDSTELWKVNSQTGDYFDYFPIGGYNLADLVLSSENQLWWTDNTYYFGSLNLINHEIREWYIDITDYDDQPLNLGPVTAYNGKIWLASWEAATYGVFSFQPPPSVSRELCLYKFPNSPGGLDAADLLAFDDYLWMLDWDVNSLYRMNPEDGNLIRYSLNRDIREYANLKTDGSLLWWAEDQLDGAVVSFNPQNAAMIVYSLPAGSQPRNIYLRGGKVWYTDYSGSFGQLDPLQATGQTVTLVATTAADNIVPECSVLSNSDPSTASFIIGTFSWTENSGNLDQPQNGLDVYSLPQDAAPFGIAASGNFIWVSDRGRQKLIRVPLEDDFAVFLPLILK